MWLHKPIPWAQAVNGGAPGWLLGPCSSLGSLGAGFFFAVLDDFWGVILGMLQHPKVLQAFPEDGNFIPLSMQHSQLLTQLWEGNPAWIQLLAEGKGESDPTAKTNQGQTRPITPRSRWH